MKRASLNLFVCEIEFVNLDSFQERIVQRLLILVDWGVVYEIETDDLN